MSRDFVCVMYNDLKMDKVEKGEKAENLPISEDNKKVEHSSCHEISIMSPSRSFLPTTSFQLSSTFNAACQKLPIN